MDVVNIVRIRTLFPDTLYLRRGVPPPQHGDLQRGVPRHGYSGSGNNVLFVNIVNILHILNILIY